MSLTARNRRRKRHDIRRVLYACGAGLLCTGTLIGAKSFTLVRDSLRNEECAAIKLGQNTRVYDVNQKVLSVIASEQNRQAIRFDQMPKFLIDATIAIEDKKFFDHRGIDYQRIAGAAVNDVGSSGGRQGGSTITMQLMKNLCHPTESRTVSNKLLEAYYANDYEKKHSKNEILQRYLNSVFLGNFAVGVQAASLTYFDKPASKLTLPQAALLAGLPQAPSDYNPRKNKDAAIARRNLVLTEMEQDGYITPAQAAKAKQAGLGLKAGDEYSRKLEGFFVDYVEAQLSRELGKTKTKKGNKTVTKVDLGAGRKKVRNGGYRVYTTIDPKLQNAARSVLKNTVRRAYGTGDTPDAAIVMIEARTGKILAMASTRAYSNRDRFNLAGPSAKRQAGSTYKTFVLTAMLKAGVSPATRYFSVSPIKITGSNCADEGVGSGTIKTYGGKGSGSNTIQSATLRSDNSVYAQMTCDIGPQAVFDTAKQMGIRSQVDGIDNYNIALGLGGLNQGVNVLEMARAYAPLANGGYRVNLMPMTKLIRADGKVNVFKPARTRIFSDGIAYEATKILQANVQGGTGTRARLPNVPVAGKTGTVDNQADAWFVGYTPKYVTAVWLGYTTSRRSVNSDGGRYPAQMWHDFMAIATRGESGQSFPLPKTPFVAQPFSGYYKSQAAALAAKEAAKKAPKPKPEDDEETDTGTDSGTPTNPGGGTPTPAPPAGGGGTAPATPTTP